MICCDIFADCFVNTDQPEITTHSASVPTTEGDNLTLSCNATANPAPTISWTRDGSPVNTTNNSRISLSDDNKQLTITNVNRTDSGKYRCVASNKFGNDTSSVVTLDVQCKYSIKLSTFLEMISPMLLHKLSVQMIDQNTAVWMFERPFAPIGFSTKRKNIS